MSEQEIFEKFISSLNFDISEYIDTELTDFQSELIEEAIFILKENIVDDVKKLGGNIEKNKEKFENFLKKAESELQKDEFKNSHKELMQLLKDYSKKLRQLIEKTCVVIIPVKELPWVDVIFRSIPLITFENKKLKLLDTAISYYGEIKCLISKTTIYGKMKEQEPLFAPFMGDLDLGNYELDKSQNGPKSEIFSFVHAIINSFDSKTTRNQLAKYHEGYQRHGEPICDFLMDNNELLDVMKKVQSGLDSGRIKSDIAICSMAVPMPDDKTSLIIVVDDGQDKDGKKFHNCFEALLKFSAACCEAPSTKTADQMQSSSISIQTGGNQDLKVWTAEELAQDTQNRGTNIPSGMDVWTEEDLQKMVEERTDSIPEGMEIWTEEDLQELAKKRQGGGLDIPEWKPDDELIECSKCGYNLRKGWSECPICNTPVGSNDAQKPEKPKIEESNTEEESKNNEIEEEKKSDTSKSNDNVESRLL